MHLLPRSLTLALVLCLILVASLLSGCGLGISGPASAGPILPATALPIAATATPTDDDLAALSDEFDDASTLARWQEHAAVEGWPSRVETVDINSITPGHMTIVPTTSTWFEDYHGVFFFKMVTGDFDVTTRMLATGKHTDLPQRTFSLTGLMTRAPRNVTPQTWQPGGENWVFITTGYGDPAPARADHPQIETKTTTNSRSTLHLLVVPSGEVDLRIVRLGELFLMEYRPVGGKWQVSERYTRPDLPATLQVGLNAYTNWESLGADEQAYNNTPITQPLYPPDLIARSDYVRFCRPQVSATERNALLAGDSSPYLEQATPCAPGR